MSSEKTYSKEETDQKIQEWAQRFSEIREEEIAITEFKSNFNINQKDFLWYDGIEESLRYQYDYEKTMKNTQIIYKHKMKQ